MDKSTVDFIGFLLKRPSDIIFDDELGPVPGTQKEEVISMAPAAVNNSLPEVVPELIPALRTAFDPIDLCHVSNTVTLADGTHKPHKPNISPCSAYHNPTNGTSDLADLNPFTAVADSTNTSKDPADTLTLDSVVIGPTSISCSSNVHGPADADLSPHTMKSASPPLIQQASTWDKYKSVKMHRFFDGIVWGELLQCQVLMPAWPASEAMSRSSLCKGDYTGFAFSNQHSISPVISADSEAF